MNKITSQIFILTLISILCSACGSSFSNFSSGAKRHYAEAKGQLSGMFSKVTATHRDYDFIQETGGMIIKMPYLLKEGWYLPVKANVSGASDVTHRATKQHANIAVKEVVARQDKVEPNRLYIFIKTSWPSDEYPSPVSQGVMLGKLKPGLYTVEYYNKDASTVDLGSFEIPEV